MSFRWDTKYNHHLRLQRNHREFDESKLTTLIHTQQKEIAYITSLLGRTPVTVLDIGCGLGIYDVAINDYYKTPIDFYMLDKTTCPETERRVYYGHREKAAFYNNLDYTHEFLTMNGIDRDHIHCITVDDDAQVTNQRLRDAFATKKADLVISIISWGFHYPASVYLDIVHEIVADDGLVCFHCRNIPASMDAITAKFDIVSPARDQIREGSMLICRKK